MTAGVPILSEGDRSDTVVSRRVGILRSLVGKPLAVTALAYLAVLVIVAVFAPLLAPHDPVALDLNSVLSGPGADHLLGTDSLGRDVLSRLMYGGRLTLIDAAIAVCTFLAIGVSTGVVAGYFGSWTDRVFTWVVDIMLAIPFIIVVLVVLTVFNGSLVVAMITAGVLVAPGIARVVRGATLGVRNELYITAARVSGLTHLRIVVKHVLPRITGPIIVQASLFSGAALLIDAGLSYLGFGPQPPTPTWGGMITEAATVMSTQPWLLLPPGVVLGLAILAFGLIGDAVRDATMERTGRAIPKRQAHRTGEVGTVAAREDTPLLSLNAVSVELPTAAGDRLVVEGVDLEIESGEIVGLVGESGCGKSITGSGILGLLPAGGKVVAGQIFFDGVDLVTAGADRVRALRGSEIAMISQEPVASLDPVFTVGQQITELVRRHRGGSRKQARAHMLELLAAVSLTDGERIARRYPHELSGGMAQRVAIAMALAGEPRLLIADEPTTALDATVQAEILTLLKQLQTARGMAVLLITHDWSVVARACSRAYVMYAGHMVESCQVGELFEQPLHPYTAGLLDSDPHGVEPRRHLTVIPGTVPAPGDWPVGCHFAARCQFSTDECAEGPVPLSESGSGHLTRCIHSGLLSSGGRYV